MDDASPVVIVELPPDAQTSPNAKTLLKACTVALRRGACVLSASEGEAPNGSLEAVAVVTFSSADGLQVLIEVGTQRERRPKWTSRQLLFRPEDSDAEKWRSMGFTIASLAGALGIPEREAASETPEPPPRPPAPKAAPPPAPKKRETPRPVRTQPLPPFHVGARFETGPGLDNGSFRFGGALFVGYDLPGGVVSLTALGEDAARAGAVADVDMAWTRFGLGLSAAAPLPLDVEGRAGLLIAVEQVGATETDAASQVEESRSRWVSGIELDVSTRWPRASPVGGLFGAYLFRLSGGTAVKSHGAVLASSPATEGGLFLGLEARL